MPLPSVLDSCRPRYPSDCGSSGTRARGLQPVVQAVPVEVMKLERERLGPPLAETAPLTPRLLQTSVEQSELHVATSATPLGPKHIFERLEPRPRSDDAPPDRVRPRVATEAEQRHAVGHRVPALIVRPDCVPVVALGELGGGRHSKPAQVEAHGWLGDAEPASDLGPGEPLREQLLDRPPRLAVRISLPRYGNICSHEVRTEHRPCRAILAPRYRASIHPFGARQFTAG